MQHFVFVSYLTARQTAKNRHQQQVTAYQINDGLHRFFHFYCFLILTPTQEVLRLQGFEQE